MPHILLVDDEPDILSMLGTFFECHGGLRVTRARRASVARAVLMREHVDLLITDARMPGENGVTLAEAAAELGIPVLVMSGDVEWAVTHGAAAEYLVEKPFDLVRLGAIAFSLLAGRGYPPPRSDDGNRAASS